MRRGWLTIAIVTAACSSPPTLASEPDATVADAPSMDAAATRDARVDVADARDAAVRVDDVGAAPEDAGSSGVDASDDADVVAPACGLCAVDEDCAFRPCTCGVCALPVETCADGVDDDCDGRVDEGCGICGDGVVSLGETCDPPSSCPTACDDGDVCTNDFVVGAADRCDARCEHFVLRDGQPCDDSVFCNGAERCMPMGCIALPGPCAAGATCDEAARACTPCAAGVPELCNGLDDDCDGDVDDGACVIDVFGPETCNGLDDDVDGRIDESTVESGSPCGTAVGACEQGVTRCTCGVVRCVGGRGPRREACGADATDEDCDGAIDEGCPVP